MLSEVTFWVRSSLSRIPSPVASKSYDSRMIQATGEAGFRQQAM